MIDGLDARTEGGVRWLVLNRPESGNSITRAMQREVIDNLSKASADPEIRAVVLTATGTKHFCTGPNLLDPQMRPSQDRVAGDAAQSCARDPRPSSRHCWTAKSPSCAGSTAPRPASAPACARLRSDRRRRKCAAD